MICFRKNQFMMAILTAVIVVTAAMPANAKLSHDDAKEVWGKIANATDLTSLPFSIKEEKAPNAWVANGNSVTVTTGLLDLLDEQKELYGVLSHEAGHAKLGHYEKTVTRHTGLSILGAVLSNVLGSGLADVAVGVGSNLAAAGWSREQEVAADDYAVHLAYNNGEDPVGLYAAMQKISAYSGKLEPSGFNSHPPDDRRLLHIKNEILALDPYANFPDSEEVKKDVAKKEEKATAEETEDRWEALKRDLEKSENKGN